MNNIKTYQDYDNKSYPKAWRINLSRINELPYIYKPEGRRHMKTSKTIIGQSQF